MPVESKTIEDHELLEGILGHVAMNLSMLIDREVEVDEVAFERATERPAGRGVVHISFKLVFKHEGEELGFGSLLVPLPDAISMAGYLMMLDDDAVAEQRALDRLDDSTKDALIELGHFVGSAVDEAVRIHVPAVTVRSHGCQGVRADVRPAFPYEEGSELLVGRAQARIHEFPKCELVLMLPPVSPGS